MQKIILPAIVWILLCTSAFAEPIILKCNVRFEDGDKSSWLFELDAAAKSVDLWSGQVSSFKEEDYHYLITIKYDGDCRTDLSKPGICFPHEVILNRYDLSIYGFVGGENTRFFDGTCEIFEGDRKI